MRFILELPVNTSKEEIEKEVLKNEKTLKYMEGKKLKKIKKVATFTLKSKVKVMS